MEIESIKNKLRQFAEERDWEQFHSPKNLAMALGAEAGELLEVFQWETDEASKNPSEKVLSKASEELSDILIYSIRLADKLGIDLNAAIKDKIKKNDEKYPIAKAKGTAKKYTEFDK